MTVVGDQGLGRNEVLAARHACFQVARIDVHSDGVGVLAPECSRFGHRNYLVQLVTSGRIFNFLSIMSRSI